MVSQVYINKYQNLPACHKTRCREERIWVILLGSKMIGFTGVHQVDWWFFTGNAIID